jgi:hypothetical protein
MLACRPKRLLHPRERLRGGQRRLLFAMNMLVRGAWWFYWPLMGGVLDSEGTP